MEMFGLSKHVVETLERVFRQYPQIVRVMLYGSRAKGTFKDYSDIDLAVDAPAMTDTQFAKLFVDVEDLNIIYKVDLVWLKNLTNKELLENIKKDGKLFYPAETN